MIICMGYAHLFARHDLALLHDWLQQTDELYMDLDRPHSGALNNSVHFIGSLVTLKEIVSREDWPEVCICIFREKQYPIRGIADHSLLAQAFEQIPDEPFSILSPAADPLVPYERIGWGDSHDELRQEFARLSGRRIRLGVDPFERADTEKFFDRPDDVWVARSYRKGQPPVSKNRANYPPFDADPENYSPHIDFW